MSTRPCALTSLLLLFLVVGLALPASATTVEERTIRDLTAESSTIVHGTVVSTESRWNEDHSLIITDVRIRVESVLKGSAASSVVVTQPGGTVGKLRVDVSGAMTFRAGQETVLFLQSAAEGQSIVTGLFQGRFDVTEDARGQKIVRGLSGEELNSLQAASAPSGGEGIRVAPGAPVTLDQFLGGVRGLVLETPKDGRR